MSPFLSLSLSQAVVRSHSPVLSDEVHLTASLERANYKRAAKTTRERRRLKEEEKDGAVAAIGCLSNALAFSSSGASASLLSRRSDATRRGGESESADSRREHGVKNCAAFVERKRRAEKRREEKRREEKRREEKRKEKTPKKRVQFRNFVQRKNKKTPSTLNPRSTKKGFQNLEQVFLQCFSFLLQSTKLLNGAVPSRVAAPERDQLRGRRRREASVGAGLPLSCRCSSSFDSFAPFSSAAGGARAADERQQQDGPDRGHCTNEDQQRQPREVCRGDAQEGSQGCPSCFACVFFCWGVFEREVRGGGSFESERGE